MPKRRPPPWARLPARMRPTTSRPTSACSAPHTRANSRRSCAPMPMPRWPSWVRPQHACASWPTSSSSGRSDMPTSLLDTVNSPDELRTLSPTDLPKLANELREFLVNSVGQTGGHLASNLGTVELTIALHYVFDTPRDRIVWDVGHQTYAHKILPGRRAGMAGLRPPGGIAGFPRRAESAFAAFGAGHSSTSISAALGRARAAKAKGEDRHAVAVIGDGAMTAGMAFEALNNAGVYDDINLLVILNDNDMSISP